ncbi:sterol desaturase family protein [Vibrio sp. S11_S32]|uniref:sterol desaturase family protein n=1 Tax=Vibrio sp. S11_S32 TaxID=2720225 RepID=UPI00167FF048|nr:sterol desaturase family protein [Vibrio sp. S11_S32]MBD1575560.1 sterol desaturase family protein [Vibrio sp. S11_S32]
MTNNQTLIRLVCFILVLLVMAVWEIQRPRKALTQPKNFRWLNNLGFVALNGALLPFTLPFLAMGVAFTATQHQWGLLHWLSLPSPIEVLISIVLLDGIIYWQHRLFHQIPLLWRLHRVHHSDQDIDATTGSRFHFIEIWLSMWVKIAAIVILGISPIAVLLFEVILNASAMFNHSNVRLNLKFDALLRKFVVTPDMHRIHHSVHLNETNSNYGFCLSIWDRCFGSYIAEPKDGHRDMQIGLGIFRQPQEQGLLKMLTQPFRKDESYQK